MSPTQPKRPHTTLVYAISADGKISDVGRTQEKFGSEADYAHLERQVAIADATLVGAETLRAGGTAMRIQNPQSIAEREAQGKPPQAIQIICSNSGKIDPNLPFFSQAVPRWLITTEAGAKNWEDGSGFDRVIAIETAEGNVDLNAALAQLLDLGIDRLAVLGGGGFVAALFEEDAIDEFHLTVCPVVFGGSKAPTPVDGPGLPPEKIPQLELKSAQTVGQEVFLHYHVVRS